jgi:hypothetical protein
MPDDPTPAVLTLRRQRMNRTLEAIKRVTSPAHRHLKALVIFISANFALCHKNSPEKVLDG